MPSVLFVCTANRFRSPLAAGIFKKALAEEERQRASSWNIGKASDWDVTSAGLYTVPLLPVLPDVLEAAGQLGIDLSDHRSRPVENLRSPGLRPDHRHAAESPGRTPGKARRA